MYKKALKIGATLAAIALLSTAGFVSAAPNGYGGGQTKVEICHKGKTITVAAPAVPAHVGHGDTVGACAEENAGTSAQSAEHSFVDALIAWIFSHFA